MGQIMAMAKGSHSSMRKSKAAQTLAMHIAVSSTNTNARFKALGKFKTGLAKRDRVC
jgi:hypothetical protein